MLRHQTNVFLDDVTLDEVEQALGVPVFAISCDGAEFLNAILKKKTKGVSRLWRNRL